MFEICQVDRIQHLLHYMLCRPKSGQHGLRFVVGYGMKKAILNLPVITNFHIHYVAMVWVWEVMWAMKPSVRLIFIEFCSGRVEKLKLQKCILLLLGIIHKNLNVIIFHYTVAS